MKFADMLKTVGLVNKMPANVSSADGQNGHSLDPALTIDRSYQAYNPYQQYQNPYLNQGASASSSNVYYPPMYSTHGPRDYGIKVGVPGSGHGHSAPAGVGHSGYGQNGHGGHHHYRAPPGAGSGHDYEQHSSPSSSSRHKSKGSSAMTALTLLSFFFFINLLQSCLKEHMEAMNPTVMVMTTGVARNRDNKFKELYRPASKEIPLDEDEQEENHRDGHRRRAEVRQEGNVDGDTKRDYDRERFTYSNRSRVVTKQHRNQDHESHDYYRKDRDEEDDHEDGSQHDRKEIQTKLRNDYFKEGSSHYTRIY